MLLSSDLKLYFKWDGLGTKGDFYMHDFKYVPKSEYQPVKNQLIKLINLVQNEVQNHFTFQFQFIGSSSRNMITRDAKGNTGYDFDANILINNDNNLPPKKIKNILLNGFNKHKKLFNYNKIEDSKRVITIKVTDYKNSKILHSCDFAIVNNYTYKGYDYQKFIFFNKKQNTYEWQEQPFSYYVIQNKIKWLKKQNLWQFVRNYYIYKKNTNTITTKKSRSLFSETINDIYNKYNNL